LAPIATYGYPGGILGTPPALGGCLEQLARRCKRAWRFSHASYA
jgi:hypothetical protein